MGLSRWGAYIAALLVAWGLLACASPDSVKAGSEWSPIKLAGTQWTAFAIDGLDEVLAPKPQLRWIDDAQISGTGGCNAFGGPVTVGVALLRFGPLRAIGSPCLGIPGGQEDRFFKALERTRKAQVQADQLILLDDVGKVLARFQKTK